MAVLEVLVPPRGRGDRRPRRRLRLDGGDGDRSASPPSSTTRWSPRSAVARHGAAGGAGRLAVSGRRTRRTVADVVVVGGGVGGLAAALAAPRRRPRRPRPRAARTLGGKLDVPPRDGFSLRHRAVPADAAGALRRAVPRLPARRSPTRSTCPARPPDPAPLAGRQHVRQPRRPGGTAQAVEAFSPGAGAAYRRFMAHGERIWEVSERTFLAGPDDGAARPLRRLRSPRRPRHHRSAAYARSRSPAGPSPTHASCSGPGATPPTRDPRPTGPRPRWPASPPSRPGFGVWYPGGAAWGRCATRSAGWPSGRASSARDRGTRSSPSRREATAVRGVRTADGTRHRADVVVANVDAEHLYLDLLPDR